MASLGQRALPPGASSHSQLPFVMPPYNTGRPVMSHGVNLGMNVNMGLGLNGSGGFSPGTSTTTAAAAASAAMAMGTGYPGSAAAARAATAATTSSGTSKKHKCKICDKRFTRPSSLQTHMYSHTGEKRELPMLPEPSRVTTKTVAGNSASFPTFAGTRKSIKELHLLECPLMPTVAQVLAFPDD
ncbi:hypothetical protein KEM56_007468 [Ascosphaera pollenicola]|nr:hypothetical protein KEM56_007468 [Ascosphaera pollenicola]